MEKLFNLKKGDKFIINDKKLEVVGWINKFMPTLGKVPNLETKTEDGKRQLFITNFEVEKVN